MATSIPSIDQLKRALELSEEIQRLELELRNVLGAAAEPGLVESNSATAEIEAPKKRRRGRKKGKRTLSPEAIEKIRAGQRKRWAKLKKGE